MKAVRILIAEYIPSHNKGELAILKGMLKTFEALEEVEISIFSMYPEIDITKYPTNIRTIDIGYNLYLRNPLPSQSKAYILWASFFATFQHLLFIFLYSILGKKTLKIMDKPLWRIYCEYDVFILCHDEVDCVKGAFLQFSPIYVLLLAKTLRKPVVIYANGTSQFTNRIWIWRSQTKRLWRCLARYVLSNADLVTVRDEETLLYYKEISRGEISIYHTADPAFLLSPISEKRAKEIMFEERIKKNDGLLVGLVVTREVLSEAFGDESNSANRYKRGVREMAKFTDRVIEELRSTVVFIPHSVEPLRYRDDRIVAKAIYSTILNTHAAKVITKEYSAEELKGLIGQLDLLISCRVHAAINGLSMGIPTCVITRQWDKRAYNIIGKTLGQKEWICNVENLNADTLFALVTNLFKERAQISKNLRPVLNSARAHALLNGELLKTLLNRRSRASK